MKPSIGRIVHYLHDGEVVAAVVTRVHNDTCVNLTIFPDGGAPVARTSVVQTDDLARRPGCWLWPPRV